jgi:hypothetical protein
MGGPLTKRDAIVAQLVIAAFIAIFLFTIAILVSWLLLLLSLGGFTSWPKVENPKNVVIYFGISLAFVCAVLSLGSKLGLIGLNKAADKAIWVTLVVSILTAIAASFAKIL